MKRKIFSIDFKSIESLLDKVKYYYSEYVTEKTFFRKVKSLYYNALVLYSFNFFISIKTYQTPFLAGIFFVSMKINDKFISPVS
jgi:hypothetical protein